MSQKLQKNLESPSPRRLSGGCSPHPSPFGVKALG